LDTHVEVSGIFWVFNHHLTVHQGANLDVSQSYAKHAMLYVVYCKLVSVVIYSKH